MSGFFGSGSGSGAGAGSGSAAGAGSAAGFLGAGVLSDYLAPHYLPGPWLAVGGVALLAGWGFWRMRYSLTDAEDGKTNVPVPIKKDTITLN